MQHFVGLDWAKEEHALCVIDATGKVTSRFVVAHSRAGLTEARQRLGRFARDTSLSVAIERPSGLVVDYLVAAGFQVVPIHPNVVKACRSRYGAAHAKSDPGDAYLLADLLRTDGHRFRPLAPLADPTRALRALVRARDDLVRHRLQIAQQLTAHLETFFPGATQLFARLDSPIALAFLERFPSEEAAADLNERRLAAFLKDQAYSGRQQPADLLHRMRAAPVGASGVLAEACVAVTTALIASLRGLLASLDALQTQIEAALAQHPDGAIFTSFPRAGRLNAAQLLAEIGDRRERYPTAEGLAAESGAAPVTRASGKVRAVTFRWACNHRLRAALVTFTDNSRHASPWAASVYRRARERGYRHPHAIRILARAWLRVIWRCWQDRTPYDPTRHRAAQLVEREILQQAG